MENRGNFENGKSGSISLSLLVLLGLAGGQRRQGLLVD